MPYIPAEFGGGPLGHVLSNHMRSIATGGLLEIRPGDVR